MCFGKSGFVLPDRKTSRRASWINADNADDDGEYFARKPTVWADSGAACKPPQLQGDESGVAAGTPRLAECGVGEL